VSASRRRKQEFCPSRAAAARWEATPVEEEPLPERPARSTAWRVFVVVLAAILSIGLGLAVLVLSQSSFDVRSTDAAEAEREFEEIRHRLGDTSPYIVVEVRDGRRVAAVQSGLEPPQPAPVRSVRGIAWGPGSRRRVSVSTPYWVFQATRWKAKALTRVVEPFHQQLGLEFELPDLAPLGPGLVLDERYPDGRRVIVWTE